jgi:hypothetical protein
MDDAMLSRFYARVNAAHNKGILPTMAHLDGQNHYVTPKTKTTPKEKPAVTTYQNGAKGTKPWPTDAQRAADAERLRQERIARERLANLEKARAVKAANRGRKATTPKEDATMNREIAELRAQIANLTAALAALVPDAPEATPAPAPRQVSAKAPYVATSVKLVNHGHGQYSQEINGTKVAVAWNGADKVWAYSCGRSKGSAADRGAAVAQLNLLLSKAGLPAVRA